MSSLIFSRTRPQSSEYFGHFGMCRPKSTLSCSCFDVRQFLGRVLTARAGRMTRIVFVSLLSVSVGEIDKNEMTRNSIANVVNMTCLLEVLCVTGNEQS